MLCDSKKKTHRIHVNLSQKISVFIRIWGFFCKFAANIKRHEAFYINPIHLSASDRMLRR